MLLPPWSRAASQSIIRALLIFLCAPEQLRKNNDKVWLTYVLSFEGIVDLCSIFPVFGAFYRWLYSLSFVR